MPKREPTSAELKQLLDENDALRAELAQLKHKLDCYQQIRKEDASNCGTITGGYRAELKKVKKSDA